MCQTLCRTLEKKEGRERPSRETPALSTGHEKDGGTMTGAIAGPVEEGGPASDFSARTIKILPLDCGSLREVGILTSHVTSVFCVPQVL
jgi:hypothetical protein